MKEKFDSLVRVSLVELVQFGTLENPRLELAKHLLATSVAGDPGKIDTSEADYRLVGVTEGHLLFKVYDLIVEKPDQVQLEIPTDIVDNIEDLPKKGFFSRLFGK